MKERVAKRYIRQSNNHKDIEVTFAATEMRREVLKARSNKEESPDTDKVNLQQVLLRLKTKDLLLCQGTEFVNLFQLNI